MTQTNREQTCSPMDGAASLRKASGAIFSDDNIYRYMLWRQWDIEKAIVLFVGLNPSTADAEKDDPTIRRCRNFATSWGYGGLCMVNLFAYRATDTRALYGARVDPIGPENSLYIEKLADIADKIICCWGSRGVYMRQDRHVMALLRSRRPDLHHLGLTVGAHPKHPLYIKASTQPQLWKKMYE